MPFLLVHHPLYYPLVALLALTSAAALLTAALLLLRRRQRATPRAAGWMILLLAAVGGTQLHHLLSAVGAFQTYPRWEFFPLYLSLSIGPLLFFYVKCFLYPRYQARLTDSKHFLPGLGQLVYFAVSFLLFRSTGTEATGRYFYNPFYGGIEQGLFIVSLPFYLLFARRYVQVRIRQFRHRPRLPRSLWYLRKLLRITFYAWMVYAALALGDFLTLHFFTLNLRSLAWYTALQSLSFAGLTAWISVYGFQIAFWGGRLVRE